MNDEPCVETTVRLRSHSTSDIDELASSICGWDQLYDQLSPGYYCGNLTECWVDDFQIIHERSNRCLHQMGYSWHGARVFGIPMTQVGTVRFGTQLIDADMPVTLGPGQELDYRTPPMLDMMSIVLSAEKLSELSITLDGIDLESTLGGSHCLASDTIGLMELRNFMQSLFQVLKITPELLTYPAVRKGLCHALLTSLLGAFSNQDNRYEGNQRTLQHKLIVERAKQYILEAPQEPLTIAELCSMIGVSRRTLQTCFQKIMGTNPVHYLRAVRLNQVRRALRQSTAQKLKVQDIACNWGFWHLSSFTSDYKRMFGELPSQTLHRPR